VMSVGQTYEICADGSGVCGGPVPASPAPSSPTTAAPTSGAADFCTTHTCIPSFSQGTGYIVQCADGEWSHSGGVQGACSGHGGETSRTYP
jgi:hypothetical protein